MDITAKMEASLSVRNQIVKLTKGSAREDDVPVAFDFRA